MFTNDKSYMQQSNAIVDVLVQFTQKAPNTDKIQPTWSLVLTTHSGFVAIAVAAPAPEAAIILAPNVS